MPNLLITSFGASWPIIPELIGFTNPAVFDFYKNHPDYARIQAQREAYKIVPVDEVWLATTNGANVSEELKKLKQWQASFRNLPVLRVFSYDNLKELDTPAEINSMADLIYRMALHAKEKTQGGKLYLSLAGGRKNMSANMHEAAGVFGCNALIHVMAKDFKDISSVFKTETDYAGFFAIPGEDVESFYPFVLSGEKEDSSLMYIEPQIKTPDYPLEETLTARPSTALYDEISKRQAQSAVTLFNLYRSINRKDPQNIYLGFQLLHPRIRQKLREERIGVYPGKREEDLPWLQKIPKADLHCHFGGILSPEEMIEVAQENIREIESALHNNPGFRKWYEQIGKSVASGQIAEVLPYDPKNNIRRRWSEQGIDQPVAVAAFLSLFKDRPAELKEYIYGNTGGLKGIGIEKYEKLGDLQGSSLMQNEVSIRKACRILKRQCVEENIRYLELRCSPVNYTKGGLEAEQVVGIIMDELFDNTNTIFRLIFIASRHGDDKTIKKHIGLALDMYEKNERFREMFAGFDLAGAEQERSPRELRELFMNILEKSVPTTIHAGENMDVRNIWEAVYHLSAERIGHGLTLNDDEHLKSRIKERKIAIELCPSSNDQIIGYHDFCKNVEYDDFPVYPLRRYLDEGLKITINTDDPGISLTNLTNEYYKAACLTPGGMSKWEILQINRNGFKYAFFPLNKKKKLLMNVEKELFEIVNAMDNYE